MWDEEVLKLSRVAWPSVSRETMNKCAIQLELGFNTSCWLCTAVCPEWLLQASSWFPVPAASQGWQVL